MSLMKRSAATVLLAGAVSTGFAAPAFAQTNDQSGLVNVNLQDTTVQAPIAVAANICNVAANVLAQQLANGAAPCDAGPRSTATVAPGGTATNTQTGGLVNVNVQDTTVQLPITVAANVCNVDVNVLASNLTNNAATCTGTPTALATG
jgi:hypothetical protein